MKKKANPQSYKLWLKPEVHDIRKKLPGNVRQRVKYLIDELGDNPRPSKSAILRLPDNVETQWEVRRVRVTNWRVVYAINENWKEIGVMAIRKRPPYDYEDIEKILSELQN